MRLRGMAALPRQVDVKETRSSHRRPLANNCLAKCAKRLIVHAVDLIARKSFEQPFGEHTTRSSEALLGRLEDKHRGSIKITSGRKILGGAQQHGCVTVMAACVHSACIT